MDIDLLSLVGWVRVPREFAVIPIGAGAGGKNYAPYDTCN